MSSQPSISKNWMETDLMSDLSNFQNFQNIEKILGGVSSGVMNLITDKKSADRADRHDLPVKHQESLSAQGKKFIYSILPFEGGEHCSRRVPFYQKSVFRLYHRKLIDSLIIGILCFI
ncbi:MAG: hypothetical protein ACLUAR_16950 [Pilosibacter sp.]